MSDPFAYMSRLQFTGPMSKPAKLRGEDCRVRVQSNVEVFGDYGQVVGVRTVVALPSDIDHQKGEVLSVEDLGDFILDVLQAREAFEVRWIVRPV